ncbi:hypothetical protein BDZ45DRAFT_685194 [Acephala macrosclerotiorum]|nr:hypothetical protein BDZ45DRAFT_685194 [Acephala macrosclerotiorum]
MLHNHTTFGGAKNGIGIGEEGKRVMKGGGKGFIAARDLEMGWCGRWMRIVRAPPVQSSRRDEARHEGHRSSDSRFFGLYRPLVCSPAALRLLDCRQGGQMVAGVAPWQAIFYLVADQDPSALHNGHDNSRCTLDSRKACEALKRAWFASTPHSRHLCSEAGCSWSCICRDVQEPVVQRAVGSTNHRVRVLVGKVASRTGTVHALLPEERSGVE